MTDRRSASEKDMVGKPAAIGFGTNDKASNLALTPALHAGPNAFRLIGFTYNRVAPMSYLKLSSGEEMSLGNSFSRTQVGLARLVLLELPISGKPEIGREKEERPIFRTIS